jgi:hypothetical protein
VWASFTHHQIDIALSKDGDARNLSREERIARGTQDEDHDAAGAQDYLDLGFKG